MIKVMSSGVFDVLNLGHINVLSQAKKIGDHLIVAIQDDDSVKKYKGQLPILNINERTAQIQALPFVDEIVTYNDIDQRDLWSQIQPDVIVQGDDYIHSADRSNALKYLQEKNIRLVLLPRTQGISSTEIKKRIIHSNRKDKDHLYYLELMDVNKLDIYEKHDSKKVEILAKKIKKDNVFNTPIAVGRTGNYNIVVDGNNRLQALKKLGYKYIPCVCFNYQEIDLTNNIHYKNNNTITRLSEFSPPEGDIISFEKRSHADIISLIQNKKIIPNGETWHRLPFYVINFPVALEMLMEYFDIKQYLDELIKSNKVRYYPNVVYSCNEW